MTNRIYARVLAATLCLLLLAAGCSAPVPAGGAQCDVTDWKDLSAVAASSVHTVGLKSDGTVVTAGDNSNGQCDVSGWRDIIAISCVDWLTIGLKSDGSVVITGHDSIYGWNLGEWPGE